MSGMYMVSAQKATSVTQSALGRVTSESDLNLVICKSTLVEIYKVTSEGLKFAKQVGLWGVVDNLHIIRMKNEKKDSILITTTKYDIMILSCEMSAEGVYDITTRVHGNFRDTVPRNSSTNTIAVIDSAKCASLIAIKCYDGILKTIPITHDQKQLTVSTIRMEDLNAIDMAFLHVGHEATAAIGVLSKDPQAKLNLKVYELEASSSYNSKDLTNAIWRREINDNQAFMIAVPWPSGGVLIVGTQSVLYCNKNEEPVQKSPSFLKFGEINTYCQIDANGQRFLLANTMGRLYMMMLVHDKSGKVVDLQFELLGETAIADNLTYIDNGVVFVGSKLGDSQLIKLVSEANEAGSYINVLETFTNLGPILDMLVVDIEKQGQGQLITCSGSHKNGSLRIIRSGIGIHESANVELPGIKAMWPTRIYSDEFDDHLVLSFYGYTKIFSIFGEEFEDIELSGFELSTQTLHCANVVYDQIVQITTDSLRLVHKNYELKNCELATEWRIGPGELISVATSNSCECLVASRNRLLYFSIGEGKLELVKSVELEHEIACLDMSPQRDGKCAEFCAIGLWGDISARILQLPSLEPKCYERLKGDVIPRSILIESMEQLTYLFVSLGDGSVISFVVNKLEAGYELSDMRKVVLGTQPTILRKFRSEKPSPTNNIFACSDRPSVISTKNQKLVYSSVNLKQVDYMCQLNAKEYPNSLALHSAGTLRIGTIDSIQKLHIRTVHLNEAARRIAYQSETQTFGVITIRMDLMASDGALKPLSPSASTQCPNQMVSKPSILLPLADSAACSKATSSKLTEFVGQFDLYAIHSFIVLDQNTFEVMHAVHFQPNEFATSILSMNFEHDTNNPYYVIGCCYVIEDEPEPKSGRLLILKYSENKLIQVCEKEIKGAPYCLQNFNGKLLASISNSLKLFELKENQLNQLSSYSDNVFVTHLKCKNDFILCGDMMKSCAILTYRADTNAFELVAKDYTPVWLSAIEMIDDDNFLMCDCFQNIITLKKDGGQSNDEERKSLHNHGCIHLGEQVNVFRHGSLGMQQQSNELLANHFHGSILGGTVDGSIVLFAQLSGLMFKILNELQSKLAKYLSTAGKIQYEKWRDFESDRRHESCKNVIDGDLVETFLELSSGERAALIKDFKVDNSTVGHSNEEFSLNYFNKLVEELSLIH